MADPYVPLIVIGIIVLIIFLGGRPRRELELDEPPSGAELIDRLQHTLGIAILVESMESTDPNGSASPVKIRASFMSGRHTTSVGVTGPTESDAWAALARAAIEWRNSDFQHVPIWPGGG